MNTRMAILRPLRAGAFKTNTPSSSLLAARVSRTQQLQSQTRSYSSGQKSATGDFYKTFTRPVLKTALLAIFTYQVIYWGWVKLEQDEIKVEKLAELEQLTQRAKDLSRHLEEVSKRQEESNGNGTESNADDLKDKKKRWYWLWLW